MLFEFGKGASDFYDTKPEDFYNYFTKDIGLKKYTLDAFLCKSPPLTISNFESLFNSNKEYYFVAN